MPQTALMLKFSEVVNGGRRAPATYYDEILKCSGDLPLNILATINNLWVLEHGDTRQTSLAHQFLDVPLKIEAARYLKGAVGDAGGVIFTRIGSLLNLKLLLSVPRVDSGFTNDLIGSVSLHSNDFIETEDSSRLANGTAGVVAEFAAVWELWNPRHAMFLLKRSFYLYSRLLSTNADVQTLFSTPVAELRFDDLTFEKYFALLFGIYGVTRNGVLDPRFPTSIAPAEDVATKAGVTEDQFKRFAEGKALHVGRPDRLLIPLHREEFVAHVTNGSWAVDVGPFRTAPLVPLSDGRFMVSDLQFLLESATAGLWWSIAQRLTGKAKQKFFDLWGPIFEQYVQRLLEHYIGGPAAYSHGNCQIDAVIRAGDDIIVFEVKAGFIANDAKCSRNESIFGRALKEKFVTSSKGDRKGVRQLAATVKAVLARRAGLSCSGRIYPVLVAEDPVLQTLALNTLLNDLFTTEVVVGDRVAPLTVMTIDELERILPAIAAADLSWQDLLESRFNNSRVAAHSVEEAFAALHSGRKLPSREETFLRPCSEELIAMLTERFKDLP